MRRIVAYTLVMIGVTVVPFAAHALGAGYLVAALALGAAFVVLALRLHRQTDRRRAGALFHYSLLYLALLFAAMALDAAL